MEAHTSIERKLKSEIARKNSLRKSMEREISKVSRLTDKLVKLKNYRWQRKCLASIERLTGKIDSMREDLILLDQELLESIKEQVDFSEEEIEDYRKKFKKEYKKMLKARKMDFGAYDEELKNYEWIFKAHKCLKKGSKVVKKKKKQLDSEAEIKEILKAEIRRIIEELEILSSK
ncbi:MAG: hypothetical protein ACE5QV_02845 [Fidelibacterota bacterium]